MGGHHFLVAIFPIAHPHIDISYCQPVKPYAVCYGLFIHLALHTFSHLGWGPVPVRFAFIDWIYEYRQLCVIVHVFFLWSFMVSSFVHCAFSFGLPLSYASIISTLFTSVFSYVMMTRSSRSYKSGLSKEDGPCIQKEGQAQEILERRSSLESPQGTNQRPQRQVQTYLERAVCYSRFDPRGSNLVDRPGRKSVYGACQCGSAEEVLCVRSWSKDGWPSFRVAIFPTAHPYIDISYCQPIELHVIHFGPFLSFSLAYLFSPGLGAFPCGFAFIDWICEYCEHIMYLFACFSSIGHSWFFLPPFYTFTPSAFESSFYHLYSFHFYLLLCDDDMLLSRSYRSRLSHPSFHLQALIQDSQVERGPLWVSGLRFILLDCVGMAFILLCWLFGTKKK